MTVTSVVAELESMIRDININTRFLKALRINYVDPLAGDKRVKSIEISYTLSPAKYFLLEDLQVFTFTVESMYFGQPEYSSILRDSTFNCNYPGSHCLEDMQCKSYFFQAMNVCRQVYQLHESELVTEDDKE
jgi:hypothetical protein